VPVGFEQHYVETVVRLPRSLLPPGDSRPARLVSPGRSALSLPEDALVVAAFHSGFKVSPDIFGIWMRLLQRQPKAVLWMSVGSERGRSRLQAAAERCGVSSERIVFAQRIPDRIDHLHRLTEADLLLDTPVYNSHSSALDALWCGVPIVTARSDAFASRVCGALLELIGLGSLVAGSLEEYEDIAAALIQSPERLKELRVEVSKGIEGAALFDVQRYTRELEGAFHHMHDRRTQGLGPASFDVPRS
jgi:predicted O-linked N-acetylglucosamine transferase (SPINDLY family)